MKKIIIIIIIIIITTLKTVTNAITHSTVKWGSANSNKSYLDSHDDTMIEMRRLCREKDPV